MTPQEITRARENLGLTQRALAEYLGVAANTVNRWQAGTATPAPYLGLALEALAFRQLAASQALARSILGINVEVDANKLMPSEAVSCTSSGDRPDTT